MFYSLYGTNGIVANAINKTNENAAKNEYTFKINVDKKNADGLKDMHLTAPARLMLQRLIHGTGRITINFNEPADVEAAAGLYNLWANGYIKRDYCDLILTNEPHRLNVVATCSGTFLETWAKIYSDYPADKAKEQRYDD